MAGRMNYSFFQLTHLPEADIDVSGAGDADGDGWGVRFGWIMGPYALADVRYEDIDYGGGIDGKEHQARVGARYPILKDRADAQRLDVYGLVSYEDLDIDGLIDDSGPGVSLGLRWGPLDWLELALEANHADYGDPDASGYTFNLHLNAGPVVAFVFEYRDQSVDLDVPGLGDADRDQISAGLRFRIGGE
jgi:hypothetical protein